MTGDDGKRLFQIVAIIRWTMFTLMFIGLCAVATAIVLGIMYLI